MFVVKVYCKTETSPMRKLAPAQVPYRDDFLISYGVYMMTESFYISFFEGTLHVDKIHVWFKITNNTHALPIPVDPSAYGFGNVRVSSGKLCPRVAKIWLFGPHSACSLIQPKLFASLLGCLCGPVINSVFGRQCRKTASRGREDTRVWYQETMFPQMVSENFPLHGPVHEYFLYLVSAPQEPRRRYEPEEGYLRCSKRSDNRSHSIIFFIVRV